MSVEQHTLSGKREEVNIFLQDAPAGISIVGQLVIRCFWCARLATFPSLGGNFPHLVRRGHASGSQATKPVSQICRNRKRHFPLNLDSWIDED
jgi:hypothetical protein